MKSNYINSEESDLKAEPLATLPVAIETREAAHASKIADEITRGEVRLTAIQSEGQLDPCVWREREVRGELSFIHADGLILAWRTYIQKELSGMRRSLLFAQSARSIKYSPSLSKIACLRSEVVAPSGRSYTTLLSVGT